MPTILIVVFVFGCLVDAVFLLLPRLLAKRGVAMRRTRFGMALVFDGESVGNEPVRMLNVNGTYQSICYSAPKRHFDLVCLYHQYFAEVLDIASEQGRTEDALLVLGGGGFSLPKWLVSHRPKARVDVVEIDPKIIQIAHEFFYLDELEELCSTRGSGQLDVHCEDAWSFMQDSSMRWNVIVNDAFSGKRPLGPMKTAGGARVIRERLREGGMYLANVIAPLEGSKSRVLRETLDAFSGEFPFVYLIPERPEEPRRAGDNVLVASMADLGIAKSYRVKP